MTISRPLLIFDSGIGGLSVLRPITKLLPTAPIVYVADSAFYPYGTKKPSEIEARVPVLLARLAERFDPELIVVACNTASTIALDQVRIALNLPVVGTVPAIKPAAALSKKRVIGVLGTEATVRQPYVDRLSKEYAADCLVLRHGSAELVGLAEAKLRGEDTDPAAYREILRCLLDQPGGEKMDVIVLACTHFPLVRQELEAASPRPLAFVDGSDGIARRTAWLTRDRRWPAEPSPGIALFTSDDPALESYRKGLAGFGLTLTEPL
ncbi:MAG: glutamate racemase [Sphingosinicella sp.]|nr:glutamate racemase [Sphingosinicella sp.]